MSHRFSKLTYGLLFFFVLILLPFNARAQAQTGNWIKQLDLSQYENKVVYIDFWASWCPPCLKSFPFMDELHKQYKDKGLKVIAINLDEDLLQAKSFLRKYPVDFSIAFVLGRGSKVFYSRLSSFDPPHFEEALIKVFFSMRFPEIAVHNLEDLRISQHKVETIFDAEDATSWLGQYQVFIQQEVETIFPLLLDLKQHLEQVLLLTDEIEMLIQSIFPESEGWQIENHAKSLECGDGFFIWHSSWFDATIDETRPAVVYQLGANYECFDEVYFAVKQIKFATIAENALGMISGASDVAFGITGTANLDNCIWHSSFDKSRCYSGGRLLDAAPQLVVGEEKILFFEFLTQGLKSIKKTERIIASVNKGIIARENEVYSVQT